MHTRWSDGSGTVAAMATAAIERRYEYVAITDHSKGLKIAGGIDEVALRAQGREIAAANKAILRHGEELTLLRSIEMNLNPRGKGDMESTVAFESRSGSWFVPFTLTSCRRSDRTISGGIAQSAHSDSRTSAGTYLQLPPGPERRLVARLCRGGGTR